MNESDYSDEGRTRLCTVCLCTRGLKRHAEFVATEPGGAQWFECGNHEPHEQGEILERDTSQRTLMPLETWLRAHGLYS